MRMKRHKVVKILSSPIEESIRLEKDKYDRFWVVYVKVESSEETYHSSVTFNTLVEAESLQIGDVFYR